LEDLTGLKSLRIFSSDLRRFILAVVAYVAVSILFFLNLLVSEGNVTGQDWYLPLTTSASLNDLHQLLFAWQYNGFGGQPFPPRFGFPFFFLIQAALAPIGFVGGNEIKILSIFLTAFAGITTYVVARSFGLRTFPAFVAGLFFMTTPILFNWLMFGSIFYVIGYDLLPLSILATKKFLETGNLSYALANGVILAVIFYQPTFILVFPALSFIFALFESKVSPKKVGQALIFVAISLSVYFVSALSFFISYSSGGTLAFYQGQFFEITQHQFVYLTTLSNPIRLWGSTFNSQFETFFPAGLTFLSFLPIFVAAAALLLKPRDKYVLFFSSLYLFVFASYLISSNLHYFVYNLPFGSIFEAPSVFLVPAAFGLSMLVAIGFQEIVKLSGRIPRQTIRRFSQIAIPIIVLFFILSAGLPWWTGQTSGAQGSGPATKLNLYKVPDDYYTWNRNLNVDQQHFVLYFPMGNNIQIYNSQYFSMPYQGVNQAIITQTNNLPFVSITNTSILYTSLFDTNSDFALQCGNLGVKYIVVFVNAVSPDPTNLLTRLSQQAGLVEIASYPDAIVYQDLYSKSVVFSENSGIYTYLLAQDPTSYTVSVNSSSPFVLNLDQTFSSGWIGSVNGKTLPAIDHFRTEAGLNSWMINGTGTLNIHLYYEPQTSYLISFAISAIFLAALVLYLVLVGLNNLRTSFDAGKIRGQNIFQRSSIQFIAQGKENS
jgi:hypothetical protein